MSTIDVDFGAAPLNKLLALGLKLTTVRGQHKLHPKTRFEPPLFIQATIVGGAVQVGAYCSISGGRIGQVTFGRYCSVAPETIIGAHEHPVDWLTSSRIPYVPNVHDWDKFSAPDRLDFIKANRRPFTESCPITEIGNDVWIGQGAFIRSGVKIGDGAIIAGRSVVVKDVPPYAVVAGTPAKVKKLRFDEKIVERLIALGWWRYCIYDLFGVPFDRVEEAIDRVEEMIASGAVKEYAPAWITAQDLKDHFEPVPANVLKAS
ncbi:MAG TPA: CatB-related O-acetyltransferase [Alphaproteobacteria bacterium]|nr:CatB-related O-acetyltransferase [Alphaproteobacteria bacterium]